MQKLRDKDGKLLTFVRRRTHGDRIAYVDRCLRYWQREVANACPKMGAYLAIGIRGLEYQGALPNSDYRAIESVDRRVLADADTLRHKLNISPRDMHMMVLVTTNLDCSKNQVILDTMQPNARAVTTLVIRNLLKKPCWGRLPAMIKKDRVRWAEISAAAALYTRLANSELMTQTSTTKKTGPTHQPIHR